MYSNRLLICAENVILDVQTNSISVINILEDITPAGFPFFIPRFSLVHFLERDPIDPPSIQINIKIILESETIFDMNQDANFQDKLRTRSMLTLGGLPIQRPGTLEVCITPNGIDPISYKIRIMPPISPEPKIIHRMSTDS